MIKPELAFIMRDDKMIEDFNLKRVTIDTSFGPVHRCYVGMIYDKPVLVIYGRFNGQKVPSDQINYQQTIEAVKNTGCKNLIGTFVVGYINPERPVGTTYVLGDMVGMGNYSINVNKLSSFHSPAMFRPFCENLTRQLEEAGSKMDFPVINNATYVCFHGWPRIETKAELEFYNKMGWDIVGQTCDPEATIARLYGLCYAGIAVQIDGSPVDIFRKKTSAIVMQFIKDYKPNTCSECSSMVDKKNLYFKEFPDYWYEE